MLTMEKPSPSLVDLRSTMSRTGPLGGGDPAVMLLLLFERSYEMAFELLTSDGVGVEELSEDSIDTGRLPLMLVLGMAVLLLMAALLLSSGLVLLVALAADMRWRFIDE